jgi:tetratricopeptide (TPR) repeat protein
LRPLLYMLGFLILILPLLFILKSRPLFKTEPQQNEPLKNVEMESQEEPLSIGKLQIEPETGPEAEDDNAEGHEGAPQPEVSISNQEFLAAQEVFNAGRYPEAASLFREIARRENDGWLGLGLSLYMMRDMDGTIDALTKYVIASGKQPVAKKILAFAHYQKDDLENAIKYSQAGLMEREDAELRRLYDKAAKDMAARGSGNKESTEHFSVIFDGYGQGGVSRPVLRILEEAYSKIGSEMGYYPEEPITVILYRKQDFHDVTQKPQWAGGVYDGKIRLPVRRADTDERALRSVLFHEYTHALVHSLAANCPVWINEGLAEYFSHPPSNPIGQVISLRSLERSFSGVPDSQIETAYLESCSAVRYLINQYGLYKVKLFLDRLGAGASLDSAFEEAFYQSYGEFVSNWGR